MPSDKHPRPAVRNVLRGSIRGFVFANLLALLVIGLSGCYVFDFINGKKRKASEPAAGGGGVLGQPLGQLAGGPDDAALQSVYEAAAAHPPAALRPDPDFFVRRLLRQYRGEGATMARTIGRVEQFRLLLGGASADFSKAPQETYDATSLLAVAKVAEETCRALVAPNPSEHGEWVSILPYPPEAEHDNIRWLAQRLIGKPSAQIDESVHADLMAIMHAEEPALDDYEWARNNLYAKYVSVCAALALDAEGLYL